jgi:hypothetical protein
MYGTTERLKSGGLDLSRFVMTERTQPKQALEGQMNTPDPIGAARKVWDAQLIAENMARSTASNAARGILTPMLPPPRLMWQNTYRLLEFLYRAWQATLLTFAALDLSDTWSQGPGNWRIYLLVTACVQAVWWLFHALALVAGTMNEKQAFIEFHANFADKELDVLRRSVETVSLTAETTKALRAMNYDTRPSSTTVSVSTIGYPGRMDYQQRLEQYRQLLKENEGLSGEALNTARVRGTDREVTPRMMWPNMPHSRFGFVYETVVTTMIVVPLAYLHILIVDNGTILDTYNLYRTYRVYLWLAFGALVLNTAVALNDWLVLIDVAMDFYDAHEESCSQLELDLAEQLTNFPELSGTRAISTLLADHVVTPGALLLLAFHLLVLFRWDPTNNAPLNYYNFLVIWFVEWVVLLSAAFLSMVGMFFTWDHKCAYRVMMHHSLYWLTLGFWLFTVWWYALKGFRDNRDGLVNDVDKYAFEALIWIASLAKALHLYYTEFTKIRKYFNWQFQLTFVPFTYGL